MATSASINHDQVIIDSVLAQLSRPDGVRMPRLEFGEDHTHDPAVWLTFPVDVRIALTNKRIKELADFSSGVSRRLYDAGIQRIPYVRLSEVRPRGSAR